MLHFAKSVVIVAVGVVAVWFVIAAIVWTIAGS